jgi:hypothetical protein
MKWKKPTVLLIVVYFGLWSELWVIKQLDKMYAIIKCLLQAGSSLAYSSTLKKEVICFSEMFVGFHGTTRCYIPEDGTLHSHCCDNFKSNTCNLREIRCHVSLSPQQSGIILIFNIFIITAIFEISNSLRRGVLTADVMENSIIWDLCHAVLWVRHVGFCSLCWYSRLAHLNRYEKDHSVLQVRMHFRK